MPFTLSHFILSESDPYTNITDSFASDQEAFSKDIYRGFGALNIKFLELTNPINQHHFNHIYYLELGAILQHNMMSESRLEKGEEESARMYSTS